MNVNDQWMLERMQQMAASMAASVPQAGQNTDKPKTEKGESFQDMMDKAKDQKVDAPQKDDAPEKDAAPTQKNGTLQDKAPAQRAERKIVTSMSDPRIMALDPVTQAQVAAGFITAVETSDGSLLLTESMEPRAVIVPTLPNGQIDWSKPFVLTNSKGEQFEVYLDPKDGDHQLFQVMAGGERKQIDLFPEQPKADPLDIPRNLDMTVITSDGKITTLREAIEADKTESDDDGLSAELMGAGQPLFKDVKAAPVKVGETFELDTQQPEMDAKLADTIRMAAENGLRQVEIRLSPENLGTLTIKLTQSADGVLQVVLHTASPKTASLLTQHLDGLNAALQNYGQNSEVRVEVQRNEDSQQAQQQFQQADPDGRNQQRHQQQRQEKQEEHGEDFVQRLRLGLFGLEDM